MDNAIQVFLVGDGTPEVCGEFVDCETSDGWFTVTIKEDGTEFTTMIPIGQIRFVRLPIEKEEV